MIFPIPDPTFWDDPGPIEIKGFLRWLWQLSDAPLFPVRQAWVDQYRRHYEHVQRMEEQYQIWADQQAAYEIMMQQYQEEGENLEESLPVYLHHLGLSYRRTVQDRKNERPYERVDYCEVEQWYFDEYAYYLQIVTWPLPCGLTIDKFHPNLHYSGKEASFEENKIAASLSAAFGSRTLVEFNERGHDRPGLWIIVEHKAGRGKVPLHVSYQKCLAEMPKTASPLAFPVGHGSNSRSFIVDLGEIINLLIGGSMGGGKSNILNVMLCTIIKRNSPQDLRLFLGDMKRVEFAFYKGIPHLGGDVPYLQKMTLDKEGNPKPGPIHTVAADYQAKEDQTLHKPLGSHIVTEGQELSKILDYALAEIERRTELMEKNLIKKISTWNKRYPHKKLSHWVIVIDELADVMLQPSLKKKVEPVLIRIAQLGRAMGVHLILATQTPKNEVVTLMIQNNIINRIVFRCGTGQASGVMLDGLYDAARLVPNPGRCIFREGAQLIEIQTPEITDLTVKEAVRDAKAGKIDQSTVEKKRTVAPDKVFEYALKELSGYCSMDDLYKAFRANRVPRAEIVDILREWEVRGAPPALEPEIEIGDDIYYLAPSLGGRLPRQLVPGPQFIKEFESKWQPTFALRAPRPDKNPETVTWADSKSPNGSGSESPTGFVPVEAEEALAAELDNEYQAEILTEPSSLQPKRSQRRNDNDADQDKSQL